MPNAKGSFSVVSTFHASSLESPAISSHIQPQVVGNLVIDISSVDTTDNLGQNDPVTDFGLFDQLSWDAEFPGMTAAGQHNHPEIGVFFEEIDQIPCHNGIPEQLMGAQI